MSERIPHRLTTDEIAPLLECLRAEESDVRNAALSSLVRLPIEPDAWWDLARETLRAVSEHGLDAAFLTAMTRMPIQDVRAHLRDLVETGPDDLRSPLAHALAEVRDDAGVPILMAELRYGGEDERMQAAESLARCGVRDLAAAAWDVVKEDPVDDVRFFVSIAVARSGDLEPLRQIVSKMGYERGLDLRFAWGDPLAAQALLQSIPPLPEPAVKIITDAAKERDFWLLNDLAAGQSRGRQPPADEVDDPVPETESDPDRAQDPTRHARVLALVHDCLSGDLLGSEPDGEAWCRMEDGLRHDFDALLDEERARFIREAFGRVHPENIAAGNFLVQLVPAGPGRFRPDVAGLFEAYRRVMESGKPQLGWQAAWVASRAELRKVIRGVTGILLEGNPADRAAAARFVEDAARYAPQQYGPIFGGGSSPPDVPLLDDMMEFGLQAAAVGHEPEESSPLEESDDTTPPVYAVLDCEEVIEAGREFELTIGIAPHQTPGVMGEALEGLEGKRNYFLTIHVVADGFNLRQGEAWRNVLAVTDEQSHPTKTLHLVADPPKSAFEPRGIQATFSANGQIAGVAFRALTVVATRADVDATPAPEQPRGRDIVVPRGPVPPDLTVVFYRSRDPRKLRLTLESPHEQVNLPEEDLEVDIGEKPDEYAKQLIQTMNALEGRKRLYPTLLGKGRALARMLPDDFWRVLRDVSSRTRERPTILLLSEDPYVPWELAAVEPPLDHGTAPFLAAQLVVGRWILRDVTLPPPHRLTAATMAAVAGNYENLPRWENLEAAFEERQSLKDRWDAEVVEGTYDDVMRLLRRQPSHSIVHIALHGKFSPRSVDEGLALVDEEWLSPDVVLGTSMHGQPFVFLNACQVGAASDVLSHYAGMAAAFLTQGAAGVIAPLWSVKDEIAKTIALAFYHGTLKDGLSAGEAIRAERAKFTEESGDQDDAASSSTFMAYQYFGHPALRLVRPQAPPQSPADAEP